MKIEDILKLIDKLDQSTITKVVIDEDGTRIKLSKESKVMVQEVQNTVVPAAPAVPVVATPSQVATVSPAPIVTVEEPVAESTEDETGYSYITSPIVGTFYESSSPNTDAYVKIGSEVKKGQVVCILEAMKLMNEIESEVEGEIAKILVKNEEMVEYGQKLFKVRIK
ncbi:MAG: acetyl-CoA carboxylase biotin carboxyl carrier protein [Fusobacteria bacterium]|nr:acetyl-CoA carboxylase biotin carboxyl carrier protein [Fusobacteriota bacterium]